MCTHLKGQVSDRLANEDVLPDGNDDDDDDDGDDDKEEEEDEEDADEDVLPCQQPGH